MTVYHFVLIGDELHCLYDDEDHVCHHFVANKVSGDVIQEPAEIHPNLHSVHKAIFLGSRSSIVVTGHCKVDGRFSGNMIVEYSPTTKQWTVWEWARGFLKDYRCCGGGWMSETEGRYILSFGGHRNSKDIDSIMIYDVDKKQCVESVVKLPVKCFNWQGVLMADQKRHDLLTFGFVKRCYKAEEFRNMMVLPTALILLIGKWFAMEFIHLIKGRTNQAAHYRVRADDILKEGRIWCSQSECAKGALPMPWSRNVR